MDVSNNAALYGAVFAPTANLNVNNNADIYGSLLGKNITVGNNADIHYDVSLGNITNSTGTPSVPTWREL
jgi:predicted acyltransferase (DUF342 family)